MSKHNHISTLFLSLLVSLCIGTIYAQNEIQWRMEGTGMTKDKLINWLNMPQNRTAIENLGVEKINQLFGTNYINSTPKSLFSQKVIDHFNIQTNYTNIFK